MISTTHTGEEYLSRFNWSAWAAVFLTTGEVSAQRGMYAITLSPNFSSSRGGNTAGTASQTNL
jgi:hypothetical protein